MTYNEPFTLLIEDNRSINNTGGNHCVWEATIVLSVISGGTALKVTKLINLTTGEPARSERELLPMSVIKNAIDLDIWTNNEQIINNQ